MKYLFWEYPPCSTCRKARQWLLDNGIEFEARNIVGDGPSEEELKELIKIQSELKAPKSKQNAFGGFRYRSAEDILEAVKPLLAQYGCLLTLSDDVLQIGDRFFIRSTATFKYALSGLFLLDDEKDPDATPMVQIPQRSPTVPTMPTGPMTRIPPPVKR